MSSILEDKTVILNDLIEHIRSLRMYLEMFKYAKHIDEDTLVKFNFELHNEFADDMDVIRELNVFQYGLTFRRVNELIVGIRSIDEVIYFCKKSEKQLSKKVRLLKRKQQSQEHGTHYQ